jgi:hypothetical protein
LPCCLRREAQPHVLPVTAASGNVAAAAVATLPAALGLTTSISGFEITASGATTASCVNATVNAGARRTHCSDHRKRLSGVPRPGR